MQWNKHSTIKSTKSVGKLSEEISVGLELEKSFFLHQILPSLIPIFHRKNKFEGIMRKGQFHIFGRRILWGMFIPLIISVKGNIQDGDSGSLIELKGCYNLVGRYFASVNILAAIALVINMAIQNQFDGLPILFALNAGVSSYIFPIWAGWNFEKVEKEIKETITEHNNAYAQC